MRTLLLLRSASFTQLVPILEAYFFKDKALSWFFLILFFLLLSFNGKAQIMDDTTKQIYSPKTSLYFLEKDVLDGLMLKQPADTSIEAFHQFNQVNRNENLYMDLGGFGTATRPLYYKTPGRIGTQLGIHPFEVYLFNTENVKYFDTKSPFTQAYYIQGSRGEQAIDFIFSRNVNKNLNFGLNFNRVNNYKQFGQSQLREVWYDNIGVVFNTYFRSKNEKYLLMYHFAHLNVLSEELGGVEVADPSLLDELYAYNEADAILGLSAQSWQTHNNHHLYHQFQIDTVFTAYHILDVKRQRDTYTDREVQNNTNFYPQVGLLNNGSNVYFFDNFITDEGTIYHLIENQGGIKGRLAKFSYRAYFKNRTFNFNTSLENTPLYLFNPDSTVADVRQIKVRIAEFENFIGGKLFYQFSKNSRLTAEAEHLLGRDYLIHGFLDSKNIRLGVKSVLYSPSLIQRQFTSNHFLWRNPFSNVLVNEAYGGITLQNDRLLFSPFGSYQIINNYIYFDTLARPVQTNAVLQVLQAGSRFSFRLGKLRSDNLFILTQNLGQNLIRFPQFFFNSRFFCEDCIFKKILNSQFGVELHYKSNYLADLYMPVSKQFFLQNNYVVNQYVIADVFLNIRLKTVRAFLKMSHINQAAGRGYITTPFFPGLRRTFSFGINWMFFN